MLTIVVVRRQHVTLDYKRLILRNESALKPLLVALGYLPSLNFSMKSAIFAALLSAAVVSAAPGLLLHIAGMFQHSSLTVVYS